MPLRKLFMTLPNRSMKSAPLFKNLPVKGAKNERQDLPWNVLKIGLQFHRGIDYYGLHDIEGDGLINSRV